MSMSSELGAWRQKSDLTFLFIRHVQLAVLTSTSRRQYEKELIKSKFDFCLRAHNSDGMYFFSEFVSPGPQVGNYEANGKLLSKNSDSKLSKK